MAGLEDGNNRGEGEGEEVPHLPWLDSFGRQVPLYRSVESHPYDTTRTLGSGVSATVDEAVDKSVRSNKWARKIFINDPRVLQVARTNFIKEVSMLRRIERRNGAHGLLDGGPTDHIVRIHDAYVTEDLQYCLVMGPVADGGSLDSLLEDIRSHGLREEGREMLRRGIGCLTVTLAFLHDEDLSIFHGDLHPGNILFHQGRVLLTDFGGSIQAHGSSVDQFKAPESTRSGIYNTRSDCFGLGRILEEIFKVIEPSAASEFERDYPPNTALGRPAIGSSLRPFASHELIDRAERCPVEEFDRFDDRSSKSNELIKTMLVDLTTGEPSIRMTAIYAAMYMDRVHNSDDKEWMCHECGNLTNWMALNRNNQEPHLWMEPR